MTKTTLIPELIQQKIYLIRNQKVMLDKDLASLYGTTTSNLNKAIHRNIERFPEDFMFQLNTEEFQNLMFHFGTSKQGGTRKLPYAFTEHGILMLSSVLRSPRAIQVNIQIMRTFVELRELLSTHKDLKEKIDAMEEQYDEQFNIVFETIKQLIDEPTPLKKEIGFHTKSASET